MVSFESPWFLALIPLICLWLLYRGRARGLAFSSLRAGESPSLWARTLADTPGILIRLAILVAVIILANPVGEERRVYPVALSYRIAVVLDKSGSMSMEGKEAAAREAARSFFSRRANDAAAFIVFAEWVYFSESASFTRDREYLLDALDAYQANGAATAIGDGIVAGLWFIFRDIARMDEENKTAATAIGYSELRGVLLKNDPIERQTTLARLKLYFGAVEGSFIVVVTDGDSNAGVLPERAIDFASEFAVPVYMIGIGKGMEAGPSFARNLLNGNGGYFHAADASELEEMFKKIEALKQTKMAAKVVTEPQSYTPLLWLTIVFLCLAAALTRFTFIVIE